jgi:hypothetical protein
MTWYSTGTASVTNGSTTVAGTGTSWSSNVKLGEAFQIPGEGQYEITEITNNGQLKITPAYQGGSKSNVAYTIVPVKGFAQRAYEALTAAIDTVNGHINGALAGRFAKGTAAEPGVADKDQIGTGLFWLTGKLGLAVNGVQRVLLGTTSLQVDVPVTGTAVQANNEDTTAGKLVKTEGAIAAALANYGGYYNPTAGVDIDAVDAGFVGLVHDGNPGTWPRSSNGHFVFVQTQAIFGSDAVKQTATYGYQSSGTLSFSREYFRLRSNDGASWTPWRQVYNSSTVVGPVSQIAGAVTGSVIERGSNANGEYVRFADGTQICSRIITVNTTIETASGGVFTDDVTTTATHAAAFATGTKPQPIVEVLRPAGTPYDIDATINDVGSAAILFRLKRDTPYVIAKDIDVFVTAIGRWF